MERRGAPDLGLGLGPGGLVAGPLQRPLRGLEIAPGAGELLARLGRARVFSLRARSSHSRARVEASSSRPPVKASGAGRQLHPGGVHRAQPLPAAEHHEVGRLARAGERAVHLKPLAPLERQLVAEQRALGGGLDVGKVGSERVQHLPVGRRRAVAVGLHQLGERQTGGIANPAHQDAGARHLLGELREQRRGTDVTAPGRRPEPGRTRRAADRRTPQAGSAAARCPARAWAASTAARSSSQATTSRAPRETRNSADAPPVAATAPTSSTLPAHEEALGEDVAGEQLADAQAAEGQVHGTIVLELGSIPTFRRPSCPRPRIRSAAAPGAPSPGWW